MQRKRHPNHHVVPMVITAASVLGFFTMLIVLGIALSDDRNLYFMIMGFFAVAETISVYIVVSQALKHCQCPGCGKSLERDKEPMQPGRQFTCEACDTVWVSRLGGGRVDL